MTLLIILALIVLILWGGGFVLGVAGGLIHLLLLVAGILFIIGLVSGRRSI